MRTNPDAIPQQPEQPPAARASTPTSSPRWERAVDVLVRVTAPWVAPIVLRGSRNEYGPIMSANGASLPARDGLKPPRGVIPPPAIRISANAFPALYRVEIIHCPLLPRIPYSLREASPDLFRAYATPSPCLSVAVSFCCCSQCDLLRPETPENVS